MSEGQDFNDVLAIGGGHAAVLQLLALPWKNFICVPDDDGPGAIRKFGVDEARRVGIFVADARGEARQPAFSGACEYFGRLITSASYNEDVAREMLVGAAAKCGLISEIGASAVKKIIASGIKIGKRRGGLVEENQTVLSSSLELHTASDDPVSTPEGGDGEGYTNDASDLAFRCSGEPENDTGNGQRLLKRFGDDLLHVRNVGWHTWAATHWEIEGGNEAATRYAQLTAAAIAIEAGELAAARKAKRLRWSVSSGNTGKIDGMLKQALPHRTVAVDDLDPDKLAFNVTNGTIHFVCDEVPDPDASDYSEATRKRYRVELSKHDRNDKLTKVAPVEYDPAEKCPAFEAAVRRFLPIEAIRSFVQRYHGYALTGLTGEQCLVFNYGTGANWKSTFVEIIARIMGPYCATIAFESLSGDQQRSGSQATPDLARLPGARLVRASEPERGVQFKESLIKSLTGGDPHYLSDEHKAWRKQVLQNAGNRCEAIENGFRCSKASPESRMFADHIVERRDGGAPFDPANGQCLCGAHHTKKTAAARAARARA